MMFSNTAAEVVFANVILELFCAAVTAVPAVHLLFGGGAKTRQERLLTRILCLHIVMLVCDASAWAFDGVPGLRGPMLAANFLEFSLGYVNLVFLTDYIVGVIAQKRPVSRIVVRIVTAVCALCVAAGVVSQFNGVVYFIDERNVYRAGPWYAGINLVAPAVILFFSSVVAVCARSLDRGDTPALLSYVVFLCAAAGLQVFFPELMLYYAAYTLSLLVTWVNIHVRHEKLLKDRELELADARISIMVSRIRPHFLYNALSAVSWLCVHDPALARETVNDFSRYLRANLAALTQKAPIPFEEEMRHVETYLSLERKRFGDRIRVERRVEATDFRLPPLTLQPLVENAVQHGITVRDEGGTIVVGTRETEDGWEVSVVDDGVGFAGEEPERRGMGIENVRFRLENICRGSLDVRSTPGEGTTAVIRIPKEGHA